MRTRTWEYLTGSTKFLVDDSHLIKQALYKVLLILAPQLKLYITGVFPGQKYSLADKDDWKIPWNLGSASSCAAHFLRASVHQRVAHWWGSPRKRGLSWFPRWAGAWHTRCDCTALGVTPPPLCAALHRTETGQPTLDVASRWPPQPSLPIYIKKKKKSINLSQADVMRELAGMATLPPYFGKDCLRVSPYLCMGLQSCQHNIGSGDLLLWSKKRNCGATTGQVQYGRTPERFPRRREGERLWDTQAAEVAHCSAVYVQQTVNWICYTRKPWPTLLSKPRNAPVFRVKLF